jgi:tellurite methyltransferase
MALSFISSSDKERERWNRKYREAAACATARTAPDPFLVRTFSEFILPEFPRGGSAFDLAGGAGRHTIWLAKQGWQVTIIDISETGIALARQNAGPLASHIHFVVDDLTHFNAAQTQFGAAFDVIMGFFYLERKVFPEVLGALRPGGLLIYKTYLAAKAKLPSGPKNPEHLLEPGELVRLATGLRILHCREEVTQRAFAELVARKEI